MLTSFDSPIRAAIFGTGGLGQAFRAQLAQDPAVQTVHSFSRNRQLSPLPGTITHTYDPTTEQGIGEAFARIAEEDINLFIVTIGTLHSAEDDPEKAIRDLSMDRFLDVMRINAGVPAMIGKHALAHLRRPGRRVFTALSARVGSISDNRLGGWHSYRASKAALNQLIRNLSIEVRMRNKEAIAATLHPGTVDTELSKPFQRNVPTGKLFTAPYSAAELLNVIDGLTPEDSGRCFDYAAKEILP